jgi:hypothetical protein
MAGRVEASLTGQSQTRTQSEDNGRPLPESVREVLDRARNRVVPFIPDEEAKSVLDLAQALEMAASNGDASAEQAQLENALRRYAYLF